MGDILAEKISTYRPIEQTWTREQWLQSEKRRADNFNNIDGTLSGYDCYLCRNRGYFADVEDNGSLIMKRCSCMNVREAQGAMRQSGLPDNMMDTCTFDFWETPKQWQRNALDSAKDYVDKVLHKDGFNQWFVMCGKPGCGKTRLCTTVFRALVEGGVKGFYISWRDFARQAKSVANDGDRFSQLTSRAKKSKLIYIDDFWKGKVTAADVHLAFEILNDRYCSGNITILSSEYTLDTITRADEAIGSRLVEQSKGYYWDLSTAENWRMTQARTSGPP